MKLRTPLFLLLLSLPLIASPGCKKDSQAVKENAKKVTAVSTDDATDAIVDSNYQFKISWPGEGWKLMRKNDIRQVSPDAVAGLSYGDGLTGVVIVEHAPQVELTKMADLIMDTMPIEGKTVVKQEEVEYVGLPARNYVIRGQVSDIPIEYHGKIFKRGDFIYQVIAMAPSGSAPQSKVQQVFDSFELIDGEITIPDDTTAARDVVGVGWRVKDGTFESAVTGLEVEPPKGWQVVVGADAKRINADAEVVMISKVPEAYFIVVPEIIGDADHKTYSDDRIQATAENMGPDVKRRSAKAKLLGKDTEITILDGGDMPWAFNVGIAFHDGWAVQATGWYSAHYGAEGEAAVRAAMASISFMSMGDKMALASELEKQSDGQNQVGRDHSYRNGVFRDFDRGVKWTKPDGFWEITVGQEVREINASAQFYARYANSALHLLIIAEPVEPGTSSAAYHQAAAGLVANNLNLEISKRSVATTIKSGPALYSEGVTRTAGLTLGYRVTTAVVGSRAVQLHVWGPGATQKQMKSMIDEAAQGLEIVEDMAPSSDRGNHHEDLRMGFTMDMSPAYPYHDMTPGEMRGIGSFASWGVDGQDWVGVLALCALEEGRDEEWFMDFMEQRIRDSYTKLTQGAPKEDVAKVAGLSARHLLWSAMGARLDGYLLIRDRTIYALISVDQDGGTAMRDQALGGFKLID